MVDDENSSDAQRLQKYVDRFEERRSFEPVAKEAKKDLRIEMDRRIVYGRPSKAAFRNELSPEQMQRLLEAFQQPVVQGSYFSGYEGSVPGIEVKSGDEVLFRQERNSVVTVNQFQQKERQMSQQDEPPREDPWLSQDSARDGLTNGEEVRLRTGPYSPDTDRDGVSDLQEVVLGTNPNSPDTDRDGIPDGIELHSGTDPTSARPPKGSWLTPEATPQRQTFAQDPAIPSLDPESVPSLESESQQPSFIEALYQKLGERTDLDLNDLALSVYQGEDLLYRDRPQAGRLNVLTAEQQDLFQQALDDPSGLQGELIITLNDQRIFHAKHGELKIDQYGLAGKEQVAETQVQSQPQAAPAQPAFDASAVYNKYQQETQGGPQAPIDAYERIAQKSLDNGLSPEQAKQVLKQDSFHQTLALGLGQPEADRYDHHLLNSLGSQATTSDRISTLENRIQNLESFNQSLSSQLDTLNQKLERLNQSKAFESSSPPLNHFLGNVRESISNSWQAAKNALRQKAGEVSLSLVQASARTSTQILGEETKDGLRVIQANGKRIGLNQQGDILIAKEPGLQAASEYKRLSQGLAPTLPPSIQVKQIAQVALKEKFTTSEVHSILKEHPKVKEVHANLGPDKANQFAEVAIAAAQRQNAIDSQPKQRSLQTQQQQQV